MFFWSLAAQASEPTVGGIVEPMVAVDPVHDYDFENTIEEHTWARGWASGELPRGDRWFLEARVQTHLLFGKPTTAIGGSLRSEGWWEGALGDTGWDGKIAGSLRARVGVLTERWGRLDLLPVADVLNPRDLRTGPLVPAEFQHVPVPMGVVSFGSDKVQAETVLIPFATADRMWLRDEDWSFIRQGMIEGQIYQIVNGTDWTKPGDSGDTLSRLYSSNAFPLPDSLRRGLDATVNGRNLPEELVYNGEIAERIQLHGNNLDLSLMGGWLHARQPEARLKPALQTILKTKTLPENFSDIQLTVLDSPVGPLLVDWPRTAVVGADGALLAGPVQIRAETMYQSSHPVRRWYGDATSVPQLAAGLGLDYVRGSNLVISLESRWQHLVDPPTQLLLSIPDEIQIAGGARITAVQSKLTVQLGGAYDLSFSEYFLRPTVSWRFGDHLSAEVGALVLGGATAAPETLEDSLTYTGGPASYFSTNDTITFAVSLIR